MIIIKWISKFIYSKIIKFDSSVNFFNIEHRKVSTVFDGKIDKQTLYSCLYIGNINHDLINNNIIGSWTFEKFLKENTIEIYGNTYKSLNPYTPVISEHYIIKQTTNKFTRFLNKLLFRDDFKYRISRKKHLQWNQLNGL